MGNDSEICTGLAENLSAEFEEAGKRCFIRILAGRQFIQFGKSYGWLLVRKREDEDQLPQFYPSEILDGFLFLGGAQIATNLDCLKRMKITHVVNVAKNMKNLFDGQLLYAPIEGIQDFVSQDLTSLLLPAIDFIEIAERGVISVATPTGKSRGNRVLLHCQAGASRSAAVAIAFLMKRNCWSFEESFGYVKERRPIVQPNSGFIQQLREYGETLSL